MAVIVIGGQTRNVGKTGVLCALISAMPERHWTAIKITSHAHGSWPLPDHTNPANAAAPAFNLTLERDPTTGSDTSRYLAAGAARSMLIQAVPGRLAEAAPHIFKEIAAARHVLIESNSILDLLQPDLYVVVLSPDAADFKPSARRHLDRADALLITRRTFPQPPLAAFAVPFPETTPVFESDLPACSSPAFYAFIAYKLQTIGK